MLGEFDQRNIERSIRELAGFGTRHTLSSQTDPNRGIGAARDWIYSELQRSAERSGGRMTVEKQSFVQPAGGRIPEPTTITNVVATLRGTQPASADRTYVVSGHYDSRCTDVMNATCDAPGANDDASGVAAVLEMARVMASRKFDATIVFMAVAGEEQGLLGSTYYAEQAKQSGQRIDGMFTNDIVGSSLGQNGVRDPNSVRLFAVGPYFDETPQEAADRRTTGSENDSPARQLARYAKDVADQAPTDMSVRIIYKRDRYLRGGDHIPFLDRRYPAGRFTEVNEDYRHQHQNVRVEDGTQFGDLLDFVDFGYMTRVAKVNAATLAGLASAPGNVSGVRVHTAQLSVDRPRVGSEPGGRPGRLRDRLPRHDPAVLDPHDPPAQRHHALRGQGHHEGRLTVWRARCRYRRQPQPGRVPQAGPVTSAGPRRASGAGLPLK
jgi:hypothetical protein